MLILRKFFLVSALLVAGCANHDFATNGFKSPGNPASERSQDEDGISYWDVDGAPGKPRIVIDLDQQRANFYKGDRLVGVSVVSTGREGYDTPPGEFRITEKDREHVSSIYGDYVDQSGQVIVQNVEFDKDPRPRGTIFRGAPMPYFLRIHGGIGMHAGYLPGYPASHGCIRLPQQMAIEFFKNATVGTPVVIRHSWTANDQPSPVNERYSNFPSLLTQ
jgi:lipoprotein-anchoring transpeptidase ErfK/SrfK